jgi:hypothetical protein
MEEIMGFQNAKQCTPQPTYLIIEEIHLKTGMPAMGNTIGPTMYQVLRRVLQVCDLQDFHFEGKRLDGNPSKWQYIREFLTPGKQITLHPTGKKELMVAYTGYRNILTPLPKIGGLLPELLTKTYNFKPSLTPFIYGEDPIPRIQLYGNPSVTFEMPGGAPPATVIGVYTAGGNLEFPSPVEKERIKMQLMQPASALKR